jgi:hypothetical protein
VQISTPKKLPKSCLENGCKPKNEGGLGVLDLKKQNEALLMKNLDKFLNRKDIPWVLLIWEKHYPKDNYQVSSVCLC